MVKVFKSKSDKTHPEIGVVQDVTAAGIVVHLQDGKLQLTQHDQLEKDVSKARLDLQPHGHEADAHVAASHGLNPEHFHPAEGLDVVNNHPDPLVRERAQKSLKAAIENNPSESHQSVYHSVWQLHHHEAAIDLPDGAQVAADRKVAPIVKRLNELGLGTVSSSAIEKEDVKRYHRGAMVMFKDKSADKMLSHLPEGEYKVRDALPGEKLPPSPKKGEIIVSRDLSGSLAPGGEAVWMNIGDVSGINSALGGSPLGMRPATAEDRNQLKLPPAWRDVHVSIDPNAGLQAIGKDAKGRDQYRYSDEHHRLQNEKKFARMRALHDKLPQLDAALERDMNNNDTAAAVYLIRKMGVRNGSETDTGADTFAYGATNLRARHVLVNGDQVSLDFDAKDNVHLTLPVRDERLKALLRAQVAGKGPEDHVFDTNETKTNEYLKEHTGDDFKIKDLRTYLANSLALAAVAGMSKPTSKAEYRKQRLEVARQVSAELGNTPTVALNSYIDPSVFAAWLEDAGWSV